METDSGFQKRSYYCFLEWLTTYSNLDKCALKFHSDNRNTASFVETFYYCLSKS